MQQPETKSTEALWGAKAIAQFINASVDVVYEMADDPDAPVYKPRGRYCALKPELLVWMRTKPIRA
jgi:hypothetical protein